MSLVKCARLISMFVGVGQKNVLLVTEARSPRHLTSRSWDALYRVCNTRNTSAGSFPKKQQQAFGLGSVSAEVALDAGPPVAHDSLSANPHTIWTQVSAVGWTKWGI